MGFINKQHHKYFCSDFCAGKKFKIHFASGPVNFSCQGFQHDLFALQCSPTIQRAQFSSPVSCKIDDCIHKTTLTRINQNE